MPSDEHVTLLIMNDALIARNIQLHDELARQLALIEALHAFVASVSLALRATLEPLVLPPQRDAIPLAHPVALTARQAEILRFVVAGYPSKRIALELGISQRTVENHRASIMTRTGATSVPALTRFALDAGVPNPTDRSGMRL